MSRLTLIPVYGFLVLALFQAMGQGLRTAHSKELTFGGTARVVEVVDGDTVVIDPPIQGADEVRLVGLQAPKLPLGRKGFKAWPYADEAKKALTRLVLHRDVRLEHGGADMDRHGRLLAHLYRESDGLWVQGQMLREGFARLYSFKDNRAMVPAMLEAEQAARSEKKGIWNLGFYQVRQADDLAGLNRLTGTFQVIEGRVVRSAEVKAWRYLNFGDDWRSDFTVRIGRRDAKDFERDPLTLEGELVRVRGWLSDFNGPQINVTHPEQIEILRSPDGS